MENEKDYVVTLFANQKTKRIIIGSALLLLFIIVTIFWNMGGTVVIDKDTTINNNFTIANNKEVILKDGATLTVIGNMTINGTLSCDRGSLAAVVRDTLTVTGKINCILGESTSPQNGIAITLTAKHILFDKNSALNANGHIEVTTDAAKLLLKEDAIANVYEETTQDKGISNRIGPFTDGENTLAVPTETKTPDTNGTESNTSDMVIGGTWSIGDQDIIPSELPSPPPTQNKNMKEVLVLLDTGERGALTLQDLHVIGKNGRAGADDIAKNCTATGKNGENAFHVRVNAGSVTLNNFQLDLGGSGKGGDAETKKDCTSAVAQGGAGGEAGNFKITASESIHILNFTITPGRGGNGGNAVARARNGENSCPGENGGDATATGGSGGKSKKELTTMGNITGLDTIKTERVVGGDGGNALATPGKGGSATECGCSGGKGGDGNATGGKGGDAFASVPLSTTEGHGGDGGSADTRGAPGGNGGSCPHKQSGGDGGRGCEAKATPGAVGRGVTASGNIGVVKNQGGGDGGAGGDGCNPGVGGQGGIGAPIGAPGPLGKNMCADTVPVNPPTETGTILIRAVLYKGKYLPVDQLIILNEAGCGAEHWHAAQETVKATNGEIIADPGPQCGFGKVKDNTPEMVPKETARGTLIMLPDEI